MHALWAAARSGLLAYAMERVCATYSVSSITPPELFFTNNLQKFFEVSKILLILTLWISCSLITSLHIEICP